MVGDQARHAVGHGGMGRVKLQKLHDSAVKVLHIGFLQAFPPAETRFAFFGIGLGGPFGFPFGRKAADGFLRCPDSSRECPAALLFLHCP